MKPKVSKKAKKAALAIIRDLIDRRGLRQAWDSIDADIRKEIQSTWAALIDAETGEKP